MENLNKDQLEAVLHKNGPLLIVAGAGTGKTTAITQRIAYLIEQGLAGSDQILALTFTEKAAAEMEDRVGALLPVGYLDLWISTFHCFAERILKEHGLAIGLPGDFKLLNEFEQWALIKKNLDKFSLDYYRPLGNPTKFIRALLKHFSRAKDEDVSPSSYLEHAEGLRQNLDSMLSGNKKISKKITNSHDQIDKQEIQRLEEIANAYHVYQQLLLDNNALDFGDLINYVLKLFRERPAILAKYRRQFKYILVDEFQDTNWAQYELIKLLAAPENNLVVVGDDDQSIYRFRGASMSNILQFVKDFPDSKKIVLTENYRSAQNILDLSYKFIKQNNPNRLECQLEKSGGLGKSRKLKIQKLSKRLVAQTGVVGRIEVLAGKDLAEEVKLVADKIMELKKNDKSVSLNDFAVLVRANQSANDFISEFERRGLSYIFGASRGLYAKPVIMDAIAYLKLLDNYHESASVWRILNLPFLNFSYEELVNLNHLAGKKAWSLYETISNGVTLKLTGDLMAKISPILSLIAKHSSLARERNVSEVFLAFMNDSGYLKYLTSRTDRQKLEALRLLNQFLKRLQSFENSAADKTVKAFLAELNLEMEAGEEGSLEADLEAGPEAIKILTVHGAKGLEFKYVFIANLVDKRFPTIERNEEIELPEALVKEILPDGEIHLEEERRLFYVAMTRAKQGLYFSWAPDYGGKLKKKPSRFLTELGMEKYCELNSKSEILNYKQIQNQNFKTKNFQIPAHFSYSQLAAYSNCPYQYRFAHILKIPTMGKQQFSFGKTLHGTLQKIFILLNEKKGSAQADLFGGQSASIGGAKNNQVTFEEILKLYEESWIDDWYESKQKKQERQKQGREILKVFYDKYKNNWPETLFLEKSFNWKVSSGPEVCAVRGTIDRVDKVSGGLKLVDYKTGKPKQKLDFQEKEQLLIYQLAAEELFKEPVAALAFYYLDDNSEVEFLGTGKELQKIKEKIIDTVKAVRAGQFDPKPGKLCRFCDFRGICEFRG